MNKKIEFLDLGQQPLANYYLDKSQIKKKEKKYRLIVCFDNQNKLVSIKKTFSSKMMFNNKYPYRSSMSKTMQKSFKELAKHIKLKINPRKILEYLKGLTICSYLFIFHLKYYDTIFFL